MKKIRLLIIVLLVISCQKKEEEKKVKENIMASPEWVSLFDGTSFNGWHFYNGGDISTHWSVKDDELIFDGREEGSNQNYNIVTDKEYTNFELSLEWKISKGGNSGIFWGIFEDEKYDHPYSTGAEIQVLDNELHPDAQINPKYHQAGALYDMVQPSKDVCKPAGEWNAILLKINHITNKGSVTLNGVVIVEFPVHGEGWNALVANSKFKDWDGFGSYKTGRIGLQDHRDPVRYRNIKIKELD